MDVQTSALSKASCQDVEKAMPVPQNIMNSLSLENANVGSDVGKYTTKPKSRGIVEPPQPPMTINSNADVSSVQTAILPAPVPLPVAAHDVVRTTLWNFTDQDTTTIAAVHDSPCECVAFHVKPADLIIAGENHREVFESISGFLSRRNWKHFFVESSHDFHIKISRKASISQFRVTVFLDPSSRQHVLDVVDLTTDRDFPGDVPDIRQELLEYFAELNPKRTSQRRRKQRSMPPFGSESDNFDHLSDSLALFCSWADSSAGEEQLLGVRSLFSLLQDNEVFLRHENTVELIKTAVMSLLSSTLFLVRELTVNFVLELCQWDEYQNVFAHQSLFVRKLIEFINPVNPTDFFSQGDLIERCGEIVSILCEPFQSLSLQIPRL